MKAVRYPHDSWVLDEGDDPAVARSRRALGVRYFTRVGRAALEPAGAARSRRRPRPATSTPGSMRATADDYDFLRPARHRPPPAARSIWTHARATSAIRRWPGCRRRPCTATWTSWIARGPAEQELVLQGPLQLGFYGPARRRSSSARTAPTARARPGDRRLPADARGGPSRHGRARRAGYRGVYVPEVIAERRAARTLRDLPSPAVRLGVLDDAGPALLHAAAAAPLPPRQASSSSSPRPGIRSGR